MALFVFENPSTIMDQHFGHGLNPEDILLALSGIPAGPGICRRHKRIAPVQCRDKRDQGSTISIDRKNFVVSLDVKQFSPEEISVKAMGNEVIVEGKHEEKEDEFGTISRHFVRRYQLPEGHNSEDVVSSLSRDGILSITAPKKSVPESEERVVPITITGNAHATAKDSATPVAKL